MSNKATCPGCDAHTSGVYRAITGEESQCPHCGLSGDAIREVARVRETAANAELVEKYAAAVLRADRAEAEAERLRKVIRRVADALNADAGEATP